ncbi:MAG: hypothetical protein LBH46_00490 [Rickettsiales bacterium]|jgi:hypothetical protein|nr:hypothetical protein [Rickettsiales bacterium]
MTDIDLTKELDEPLLDANSPQQSSDSPDVDDWLNGTTAINETAINDLQPVDNISQQEQQEQQYTETIQTEQQTQEQQYMETTQTEQQTQEQPVNIAQVDDFLNQEEEISVETPEQQQIQPDDNTAVEQYTQSNDLQNMDGDIASQEQQSQSTTEDVDLEMSSIQENGDYLNVNDVIQQNDNKNIEEDNEEKFDSPVEIPNIEETIENLGGGIIGDLEMINDDFLAEIQEKKQKEEEDKKRKQGLKIEEIRKQNEPEEEINLTPLEESDDSLEEIKSLSAENVDEFIKKTKGDKYGEVQDFSEKKIGVDLSDIKIEGLLDFELNTEYWKKFNLNKDSSLAIKQAVMDEIRDFVLNKITFYIKDGKIV